MATFFENLKCNAFLFMCSISGAVITFMITDTKAAMSYISGILLTWVLVSLLGVNLEKKYGQKNE